MTEVSTKAALPLAVACFTQDTEYCTDTTGAQKQNWLLAIALTILTFPFNVLPSQYTGHIAPTHLHPPSQAARCNQPYAHALT